MNEIINSFLDKPLAFIITIDGILFLGLSGLTKAFKIKIDTNSCKRLFLMGISLVIIGFSICFFGKKEVSPELDVKLLKVEFFKNDVGHTCGEDLVHIRETFHIKHAAGEKFTKVILKQGGISSRDINYQDINGDFVLNYCYDPNLERTFRIVIISSSGKTSNVIKYKITPKDISQIQEYAPPVVEY